MGGPTRSWTNNAGAASSYAPLGNNVVVMRLPHLVTDGSSVALVSNGVLSYTFFCQGDGRYTELGFGAERLTYDDVAGESTLVDRTGQVFVFHDFGASLPGLKQGGLISQVAPGGARRRWATPGGGGQHLITEYEVDALGRTTKVTAPDGMVTYTVYNDAAHEVRVYAAWNAGTQGLRTMTPRNTLKDL